MLSEIEINPQFEKALELLENTDRHVFITGRAGTGKSTLLDYFRCQTKKKVVILAPTGVAAVNVGGETIHSFFKFKPGITEKEAERAAEKQKNSQLFPRLEMIVIDEISMVRADLLDCVDVFLKKTRNSRRPFGGVQVAMIGDLYQLPPVVQSKEREALAAKYETPYFFDAVVIRGLLAKRGREGLALVELEKIYRQTEEDFIELLNAVRNRGVDEMQIEKLNRRCEQAVQKADKGKCIYLVSRNDQAEEVNLASLKKLPGKEQIYQALIEGGVSQDQFPTDEKLALKEKARVMFLNNDKFGRWVNGTTGTVVRCGHRDVKVKIDHGEVVEVEPFTWAIYKTMFDKARQELKNEEVGSFAQLPLRLAWAITIHKSQGKTFDRVIIDVGRGLFAHGQMYVALSRCRSFEGIILKKPLKAGHIRMDWRVVEFLTGFQYQLSEVKMPKEKKIELLKSAIKKGQKVEMVYLKAKDVKSKRIIKPLSLDVMKYNGHSFFGLEAYCLKRRDRRVFRVERILEMRVRG